MKLPSDSAVRKIAGCCNRISGGKVKLSTKQRKLVLRHRRLIARIGDRKLGLPVKRRLIRQAGGFLPFLIPPLLSLISGLAGRAIAKKAGI